MTTLEKIREKKKELPGICSPFIDELSAAGKSEKTIIGYISNLNVYFNYLKEANPIIAKNWPDIDPEIFDEMTLDDFTAYILYLRSYTSNDGLNHENGNRGIRRHISTLRSFLKFLRTRKYIEKDPTEGLEIPKDEKKDIVYLSEDEISALLKETLYGDNLTYREKKFHDKAALRNYAIVLTFLTTGLRVSELVSINVNEIDRKNTAFYVKRKGHKDKQYVYFPAMLLSALDDYIANERKPKEEKENALFLSSRGTRITTRQIERIIEKYTRDVNVTAKHITPHKLRSTFGTNLYKKTGDIYLVADALNHKDPTVTARHYAAIAEDHRKKAAEAITDIITTTDK